MIKKTSLNLACWMAVHGVDVQMEYDEGMVLFMWEQNDKTWQLYQEYLGNDLLQQYLHFFKVLKQAAIKVKHKHEDKDKDN